MPDERLGDGGDGRRGIGPGAGQAADAHGDGGGDGVVLEGPSPHVEGASGRIGARSGVGASGAAHRCGRQHDGDVDPGDPDAGGVGVGVHPRPGVDVDRGVDVEVGARRAAEGEARRRSGERLDRARHGGVGVDALPAGAADADDDRRGVGVVLDRVAEKAGPDIEAPGGQLDAVTDEGAGAAADGRRRQHRPHVDRSGAAAVRGGDGVHRGVGVDDHGARSDVDGGRLGAAEEEVPGADVGLRRAGNGGVGVDPAAAQGGDPDGKPVGDGVVVGVGADVERRGGERDALADVGPGGAADGGVGQHDGHLDAAAAAAVGRRGGRHRRPGVDIDVAADRSGRDRCHRRRRSPRWRRGRRRRHR